MVKPESRNKKRKIPTRKHHFYAAIDLNYLDQRTTLGSVVKLLQDELRAYVGESNVVTDGLSHRIIYKIIRCSLYETAQLKDNAPVDMEADHYIALSNSLRYDLQLLAKFADKPKPPDLDHYLRKVYESETDDNKNSK